MANADPDDVRHARKHRRRRFWSLIRALLLATVRWPAYFLSGLIPKNPDLWVVGSWLGDRFADNTKWLFLYLTAPGRTVGIDVMWISRRRRIVQEVRALGRPASWLWSPSGLWNVLRAGMQIVDADTRAVAFWASRSTTRVNLYHGIALKRIGADIATTGHHLFKAFHGQRWERLALRFIAPWFSERYDVLVASSETNATVMASAFQASLASIAVTGLPRNDTLRSTDAEIDAIFGIAPTPSPAPGKRVVLYAPTFRDFDRTGRALPLEWREIDFVMQKHEATFLLKLHPHDSAHPPPLERLEHIRLLPSEADVYPLLRHVDVLITDYSSIFFDFLLCDRPLIFYPYDIEGYRRRDREFYYPYEEVTPGHHARTPQGLVMCVDEILAGSDDTFGTARRQVRQRFHIVEGELSCQAVTQRLVNRRFQE